MMDSMDWRLLYAVDPRAFGRHSRHTIHLSDSWHTRLFRKNMVVEIVSCAHPKSCMGVITAVEADTITIEAYRPGFWHRALWMFLYLIQQFTKWR